MGACHTDPLTKYHKTARGYGGRPLPVLAACWPCACQPVPQGWVSVSIVLARILAGRLDCKVMGSYFRLSTFPVEGNQPQNNVIKMQ